MAIVRSNKKKKPRKETTKALTEAAVYYWAMKNYSVHPEIGLESWGKLRADILALNTKGQVVMCEIKSCRADYTSDRKWKKYLTHCDKFYFVIARSLWDNESFREKIKHDTKGTGAGIFILDQYRGTLTAVQNAKKLTMNDNDRQALILRMAWRGGTHKGNRPKRVYFDDDPVEIEEKEFLELKKTGRKHYLSQHPDSPFVELIEAPIPRRPRRKRRRRKTR